MPDTTVQVASTLWDAIKWLGVLFLGLLGFNLKRTITKVEEHEKTHISRDELNDTVKTIREDIREIRNHLMD